MTNKTVTDIPDAYEQGGTTTATIYVSETTDRTPKRVTVTVTETEYPGGLSGDREHRGATDYSHGRRIHYRGMNLTHEGHMERAADLVEAIKTLCQYAYADENGEHEIVCGLFDHDELAILRGACSIAGRAAWQMRAELDGMGEGDGRHDGDSGADATERSREWFEDATLNRGMRD